MTDMKKTDGLSQNNPMDEFKRARLLSRQGGGEKRIKSQHEKGKMTARERIDTLLDKGSFQELGSLATHQVTDFGMAEKRFPGDGVVTGIGKINGRRVAVYAQDFTVLGGSFSQVQAQKINRIQDLALESGIAIVGLNDSGGRPRAGRCTKPGRLWRGVRPKCQGVGCHPPDQRHYGSVCRWSGVLPRPHRFHCHGGRHLGHVPHRPWGGGLSHWREGQRPGTRRFGCA